MRYLMLIVVWALAPLLSAELLEPTDAKPQPLRILTEDYPPLNYLENGQLAGASYEILVLVYKQLGLELPKIEVLPWARAYKHAQSNKPVMLFTMSRTPAREDMFQWAGRTHTSRIHLISHTDSGIESYDPSQQHDQRVVAVLSDISQIAIEELGYPKDKIDLVDSNETLFRIFANNRAKLFSAATSPLKNAIDQGLISEGSVRYLTVTRESLAYFAFSKAVDPEFVALFQEALDQMRPQQEAILKKYGLEL